VRAYNPASVAEQGPDNRNAVRHHSPGSRSAPWDNRDPHLPQTLKGVLQEDPQRAETPIPDVDPRTHCVIHSPCRTHSGSGMTIPVRSPRVRFATLGCVVQHLRRWERGPHSYSLRSLITSRKAPARCRNELSTSPCPPWRTCRVPCPSVARWVACPSAAPACRTLTTHPVQSAVRTPYGRAGGPPGLLDAEGPRAYCRTHGDGNSERSGGGWPISLEMGDIIRRMNRLPHV
jgi:hypothetical protein